MEAGVAGIAKGDDALPGRGIVEVYDPAVGGGGESPIAMTT
jgi:hypothetical protein